MSVVLDASWTLAWCLPDESETSADAVEVLLREGGLVPPIWALEVSNALLVAERRGRLDRERTEAILNAAFGLPLDRVGWTSGFLEDTRTVVELARTHSLTTYDATYLELARRSGSVLFSLDSRLQRAADSIGLGWMA